MRARYKTTAEGFCILGVDSNQWIQPNEPWKIQSVSMAACRMAVPVQYVAVNPSLCAVYAQNWQIPNPSTTVTHRNFFHRFCWSNHSRVLRVKDLITHCSSSVLLWPGIDSSLPGVFVRIFVWFTLYSGRSLNKDWIQGRVKHIPHQHRQQSASRARVRKFFFVD